MIDRKYGFLKGPRQACEGHPCLGPNWYAIIRLSHKQLANEPRFWILQVPVAVLRK